MTHLGILQLSPEVWIRLQDGHDLLQVLVVLQAQVPVLLGLIEAGPCRHTNPLIYSYTLPK